MLGSHAGEAEDAGEMRGEPLDDGVAAACGGGGGVHAVVDDADFRDDLRRQKETGNLFELLRAVAAGHCSRRTRDRDSRKV